MASHQEFSDTVRLIYDAGLDFAQWPSVLDRLATALGASAGYLIKQNLATSRGVMVTARVDPEFGRLYEDYYSKLNILPMCAGRPPVGTCLTDRMVVRKEDFFRTEFFHDYMRPWDVHSVLKTHIYVRDDWEGYVSFGRSPRHGEWESEHICHLQQFAPHLHRAALINVRLEASRLQEANAVETLNRLSQGVVIVDTAGRPLFANRAAERLLAQTDGLSMRMTGLHAANRSEDAALRRMIAEAGEPFRQRIDDALCVTRSSMRRPYSVVVAPLDVKHGWFLPHRAAAIVFIHDPESPPPAPAANLRSLYGLTRAEAAIAIEIMRGVTLKTAADTLGIALPTARTHLQRVFQKTQTHRQAELVRLMTEAQIGIAFDRLAL